MAFPIIRVHHTGSDIQASGAGPDPALWGTAAATSASGLTVTLDGSPDLSGVLTDGSHALFLDDSASAFGQCFGAITAVDNVLKTVTVSRAFRGSLAGMAWAIGGKRASLAGTASRRLFNGPRAVSTDTSADALPGWTIRMLSGHAESIAAQILVRWWGDDTAGKTLLEGEAGAAVRPRLTATFNGSLLLCEQGSLDGTATNRANMGHYFRSFDLVNTNATKTLSRAIDSVSNQFGNGGIFEDLYIEGFNRGIDLDGNLWGLTVERCEVKDCPGVGIALAAHNAGSNHVLANKVHGCGTGISYADTGDGGGNILFNVVYANNVGIDLNGRANGPGFLVLGNTISDNTGPAFVLRDTDTLRGLRMAGNQVTFNSGYGIDFNGGSPFSGYRYGGMIRDNNFYQNTSGSFNTSVPAEWTNLSFDPGYRDRGAGDYRVGFASRQKGYPSRVGIATESVLLSYLDLGALQRREFLGNVFGEV